MPRADFIKDVQFIFAKIADRRQTILFSRSPLSEENELFRCCATRWCSTRRNPATPLRRRPRLTCSSMTEGTVRAELLARVILGSRIPPPSCTIPRARPAAGSRMRCSRAGSAPGSSRRAAGAGPSGARSAGAPQGRSCLSPAASWMSCSRPLLIGPSRHGLEELSPSHVVFFDLPAGGVRPAVGIGRGSTVVALVDPGQEKELARLQEAIGVKINRREIPSDEEVLTGAIDRILSA